MNKGKYEQRAESGYIEQKKNAALAPTRTALLQCRKLLTFLNIDTGLMNLGAVGDFLSPLCMRALPPASRMVSILAQILQ